MMTSKNGMGEFEAFAFLENPGSRARIFQKCLKLTHPIYDVIISIFGCIGKPSLMTFLLITPFLPQPP